MLLPSVLAFDGPTVGLLASPPILRSAVSIPAGLAIPAFEEPWAASLAVLRLFARDAPLDEPWAGVPVGPPKLKSEGALLPDVPAFEEPWTVGPPCVSFLAVLRLFARDARLDEPWTGVPIGPPKLKSEGVL